MTDDLKTQGKPKRRGRETANPRAAPSSFATIGPYLEERPKGSQRLATVRLLGGVVMFCLFYGFAFSLFAPALVVVFTVPLIVLGAFVVWALPDSVHAPTAALEPLLFAFTIVLIGWPNYLAVALPGLPWITLIRVVEVPFLLVFLVCVSTSKEFRSTVAAVLATRPLLWKFLAAFVALQFLSIGLSESPFHSVEPFVVFQINCTSIFFVSCYVFSKPGRIERWAVVLWAMAVIVGLVGVVEGLKGRVLWAGHIPGFLQIQDINVAGYLNGSARAATGAHRVQSTYSTPLALSELMALTVPFVLQFATGSYRTLVRAAAILSIPVLLYVAFITDSRLGLIGSLLAILAFILFNAARWWRHERRSFFSAAIVLAFPGIFATAFGASFFFGRVRAKMWGNGPQTASNEARITQWNMGLPKIETHPFGHGIGTSGAVLGYVDPNGITTVDSYFLTIALDYGIIGFIVFYGLFSLAVLTAGKRAIVTVDKDREHRFFAAVAVALTVFLVIKSVFSQQDNLPLVFVMLGMFVALSARFRAPVVQGRSVSRSSALALRQQRSA